MASTSWLDLPFEEKKAYYSLEYDDKVKRMFAEGILQYKEKVPRLESYYNRAVYTTGITFNSINAVGGLKFEDCYFLGDVVISGEPRGWLTFSNCFFEGELVFQSGKKTSPTLHLDLVDITVKKQLLINSI